ncbi:myc box-dependent-interacting protein 1 isoform X2 [Drosophila tropicalis]|uniref:myc box-dependent-interacting protein 1 isoform X2 n=1 Tax=Drosophila tropicalis TaxID=46794 RepID=UPI0035AC1DE4
MSENKGIMLAKSMQKHAGRAKEKILQNLGKVDRTADDILDDHLNNFNRQQASANRLQKEFNNYIRCIRAAQSASKSLMEAVGEVYEPQWTGYDALQAQTAASESLWQDFAHKLGDQVLIPLNTYTGQFPEMKKKVEKRNRKLIDYDGQRHSFQNLQANANKRKDDIKLTKGREQLEEARRTYEILNTELHDELPALYDSRILFLVTNLQTLFATEQVFHNETAKIYSELEAIVDKLATESQRGSNTLRKQTANVVRASSPAQLPVNKLSNSNPNNSQNYQNQITTNGDGANSQPQTAEIKNLDIIEAPPKILPQTEATTSRRSDPETGAPATDSMDISSPNANTKPKSTAVQRVTTENTEIFEQTTATTTTAAMPEVIESNNNNNNGETPALVHNETSISTSASTSGGKQPKELPSVVKNGNSSLEEHKLKKLDVNAVDLPPGVLYRVKATYGYVKEDVDELSFEIGDTIRVIEYDDPEDQEEGWLMGQKEGTQEKGLFPANFTRPI